IAKEDPEHKLVFTISGGIDSSLLLQIAAEALPSKELYAITARSPGQETELRRAQASVHAARIRHHFIFNGAQIDRSVEREYVATFGEPVFDPVVSVQTRMIREALTRWGFKKVTIIEGQCADSLFLGLPHNLALEVHQSLGCLARI